MRTTMLAAALAMVVVYGADGSPASAQSAPGQPGLAPQELDKLSQQRQDEVGPRNWGSPPPQSTVPQPAVQQPNTLLVCMGTDPWQPVYAKPSASSALIGKTLLEVAVSGRNVNGFAPIVFGAGKSGYIPEASLHPYTSSTNPGVTCQVTGVQPNGAVVFTIR